MNKRDAVEFPQRLVPLSEEEIRAKWANSDCKPLVSICCATYNHAAWIEDALCGFLAQKTVFPFEIIIRDDASNDGTTEIVRGYVLRYPNLIRHVINASNKFSVGESPSQVWPSLVNSKYMALCEGDDFWVVDDKLQKQVEILEGNELASMCVALTDNFIQNGQGLSYHSTTDSMSSEVSLIIDTSGYYHTSTFVIRVDVYKKLINEYYKKVKVFDDISLRSLLVTYGPLMLLPEVVSVYRITGKGLYTSQNLRSQLEWGYNISKDLYTILGVVHRQSHLDSMYVIARRIARECYRDGDVLQSLGWLMRFLRHGVAKIPSYVKKTLGVQ